MNQIVPCKIIYCLIPPILCTVPSILYCTAYTVLYRLYCVLYRLYYTVLYLLYCSVPPILCRAGNSFIGFPSKLLVFCEKMSKWAIHSKNERFAHSLIFGERPERIANFWWVTWAIRSHSSFLVSDLSDSVTSLTKTEEMSNSLIF